MKNQVVKEVWDSDKGLCYLTVSNKWGTFTAKTICSEEDRDVISRWTGIDLCEYKILIQTLRAKAKAFDQRAIGIEHAYNILINRQLYSNRLISKIWGPHLLKYAENARKEAASFREKAKRLSENYFSYAEQLLSSKRNLSKGF